MRSGDTLVIRSLPANGAEWMLRAALAATDHGMLVTGLDREILAVNERFGEIFGVSPRVAIELGQDPLAAQLRHMATNPLAWQAIAQAIYDQPERVYEDVVELDRGTRIVISRYSAPIVDAGGKIIGRLWTYRDVTRQHRIQQMHQSLQEASSVFDRDPEVVLRKIVEIVNRHFDNTNAILSLRQGAQMLFRIVVGPHRAFRRARGNNLRDSYCQFALSTERPIIIQDALSQGEYCGIRAAGVGLTRYLGVPIFDDEMGPVGTLCLMDGQSGRQLDELDIQFMSLLAVRVSAELARERYIRDRLASQEQQIQTQREDLLATNMVFEAMNHAFSLLSAIPGLDELLREQASLLGGMLGYPAAAVLIKRSQDSMFHGFLCESARRVTKPIALDPQEIPLSPDSAIGFMADHGDEFSRRTKSRHIAYAARQVGDVGSVLIAFGRKEAPPTDERHRIHLEALMEQVSLLLSTHVLQSDLLRANSELEHAYESLIQKEKLSVAGTLAASTAHDIRNITSSLGLLASQNIASPEETLSLIREQLGRFDVLAHRLLSYAKPRLVARVEVRIDEILDNVVTLTAAQARITNVVIEKKIDRNLASVEGDSNQIEHLFINLVLNGLQSMDQKGGQLTISAKSESGFVRVKVIDNGPGLSKEVQHRLFEPFISSRADGFGLGLYSCKRIVEAHGGSISAKRNLLSGSTFSVDLPSKTFR